MGIKRLAITFLIVVFVLGLLAALFFQTGADEQIIQTVLPKFESRFGVRIEYSDASASMTGLGMNRVEIKSKKTGQTLAAIKRLTVGVRLGPLFFGELDVTKIRIEGMEAKMGSRAGGADVAEWNRLVGKVLRLSGTATSESKSGRPEIIVDSSALIFDDGVFESRIDGIEGTVGTDGRAVLKVGDFGLAHGKLDLLQGRDAEVRYARETGEIVIHLKGPNLEVPLKEALLEILRDAKSVIGEIGASPSDDGSVSARKSKLQNKSLKVVVSNGSCTIVDESASNEQVSIEGVTANIAKSFGGPLNVRASGQSLGTDARWTLGVDMPPGGDPVIAVEIPDVSLAKIGGVLFKSEHVDWERAFADGNLKIRPKAESSEIEIAGQISVSGVDIEHERLAPEALQGMFADSDFKISYVRDEGILRLERLLVSRGLARATLRGEIHTDRLAFDLHLNVPPTACSQVLAAIPDTLRPRLRGLQLEGQISLELHIGLDENAPGKTTLDASLDNRCKISALGVVPEANYFRGPFAYVAYGPKQEDIRLVTGPGTDRWASLMQISPYVIEALLTTEDGKFWHHKGLTIPEVRRAIELNLIKKDLTHGASTITMQLAKNLFLTRERSVSRKLQELFFVWYLESNFTKEEILELYLNVVEFGPSIYGIRDASVYYFGREPDELNAIESVFLIKLLPNPIARHKSYERGAVSERTMKVLHRVLKVMKGRKWISELEYDEALGQEIVFHMEGEPLPEPRPPVAGISNIEALRGSDFESEPGEEDDEEIETEETEPEWTEPPLSPSAPKPNPASKPGPEPEMKPAPKPGPEPETEPPLKPEPKPETEKPQPAPKSIDATP